MKLWQLAGWILAAGLLALSLGTRVDTAVLRSKLRTAQQAATAWKHEYETKSATVVRDTVRVTRWATRWDTIHATTVDSILSSPDSSAVPFPVFADVVHAADSTVAACRDLVTSCGALRRAADSLAASLAVERDAYKNLYIAAKPNRLQKALPYIAAAAGFYVGAKVRVR